MREWRTIRKDIYRALKNYDCEVYYHRPSSSGECGYFEININEDFDSDWIEDHLNNVCKDWDLEYDWYSSNSDLDLNAHWDV